MKKELFSWAMLPCAAFMLVASLWWLAECYRTFPEPWVMAICLCAALLVTLLGTLVICLVWLIIRDNEED